MQALSSSRVAPLAQPARSSRPARCAVRVCAAAEDTSRRAAIGAALAGAVALLPLAAEAKLKNPAQDSLGKAKSSTAASMSAFDMEGIKKRGLKASQRKELLESVKAKALAATQAVKGGK